jgi:hypothetical protein
MIRFRDWLKKLTGMSTPSGGASGNPLAPDRDIVRKLIAFLENRRVIEGVIPIAKESQPLDLVVKLRNGDSTTYSSDQRIAPTARKVIKRSIQILREEGRLKRISKIRFKVSANGERIILCYEQGKPTRMVNLEENETVEIWTQPSRQSATRLNPDDRTQMRSPIAQSSGGTEGIPLPTRITPDHSVTPDRIPIQTSDSEGLLYSNLLRKVLGNRETADRLIALEHALAPTSTREYLIKRAIERWEDDNR